MISYLVDAVLLIALAFTSMRVTRMHRELVRLRSYQGEFSTIVHETAGVRSTGQAGESHLGARYVLVPGLTDAVDNVDAVADYVQSLYLLGTRPRR